MWNSFLMAVFFLLLPPILQPGAVLAGDEEGCLFCHRLGLVIRTGGEIRELDVVEHPGAAHASLYCSDCHPDAKIAPHPARPNPATCAGDCHGVTDSARRTHRRASAGGRTGTHRKVSFPKAPCVSCHRAGDRPGDSGATDARCRGCHMGYASDARNGIHSRVPAARGGNRCAVCHPPHPEGADTREASCGGAGCHDRIPPRMIRLAAHEKTAGVRFSTTRAGRGGAFLVIAFLGWYGGRRLSGKGENAG